MDNELKKDYAEFIERHKDKRNECIWIFDVRNSYLKYISPSVANLLGYSAEEAINKNIAELMTLKSIKKMVVYNFPRLLKFITGDNSENVVANVEEYEFICKDGTLKSLESLISYKLNKKTNSIEVFGISRNVLTTNENSIIKYTQESVATVRIYSFGKFMVYSKDSAKPIKWRTKKSEELAALLFHGQKWAVEKWGICEALWPNCDPEKVNNKLHTAIYQVKKALQNAGIDFDIKYQNGYYHIYHPSTFSDTYVLDKIASTSTTDLTQADKFMIWEYEKAISLYDNDYMALNDYFWAMSKKEYYRDQFNIIANRLIAYYMEEKNYEAAKKVISKVLAIDNLCEYAHELLLNLYFQKNERSNFIKHYVEVKNLFYVEFGLPPRESIVDLYNNFLRISKPTDEQKLE